MINLKTLRIVSFFNYSLCLKILSDKKLGVLLAQNKTKKTTGIITDGQIRRFNQKRTSISNMKVKDIMTKNPISINKNQLAAKALSLMNANKITSLCVHENKNKSEIRKNKTTEIDRFNGQKFRQT